MIYELWDTDSGNVIGEFTELSQLYADIREAVELNGAASIEAWTVLCVDEHQHVKLFAHSDKLLELAYASVTVE